MPVIVVGADTPPGLAILEGLQDSERDIRAFVSDEDAGADLKRRGFKVALGDVSDESHVEGAATRCFTAILVTEAATDDRERSFASDSVNVLEGWSRAVTNSGVSRVIWVSGEDTPGTRVSEVARVDPNDPALTQKVLELDEAQTISTNPEV